MITHEITQEFSTELFDSFWDDCGDIICDPIVYPFPEQAKTNAHKKQLLKRRLFLESQRLNHFYEIKVKNDNGFIVGLYYGIILADIDTLMVFVKMTRSDENGSKEFFFDKTCLEYIDSIFSTMGFSKCIAIFSENSPLADSFFTRRGITDYNKYFRNMSEFFETDKLNPNDPASNDILTTKAIIMSENGELPEWRTE